MKSKLTVIGLAAIGLAAVLLGPSVTAAQELAAERLSLIPVSVQYGTGTVRIDGMGGFLTAVEDVNLKVNLHQFSRNPAGFGDDRTSWSLDARYGSGQFTGNDPSFNGEDVSTSEIALLGGKYAPRKYGAGVAVNYVTAETSALVPPAVGQGLTYPASAEYKISSFDFRANWYIARTITVGLETTFSGEDETTAGSRLYNINHDASTFRGGLGAAWVPVEGVTVGAKGQLVNTTIKGLSAGGFHEDHLTWDRPGHLFSGQGFVDRGRVKFGIDYSEEKSEGREDVQISWSPRFELNPDQVFLVTELFTFSEDRESKRLKSRAIVNVSETLDVSAMFANQKDDSWAVSNPNAYASRTSSAIDAEGTLFAGGGSLKLLNSRMLVAGEYVLSSTKLKNQVEAGLYNREIEQNVLRLGTEYFFNETFVGRLGLSQMADKLVSTFEDAEIDDPELKLAEDGPNGSYGTTKLSTGAGFTPGGGIWQFDVAVDWVLSTDLDHRNTNISGYLKYLF